VSFYVFSILKDPNFFGFHCPKSLKVVFLQKI